MSNTYTALPRCKRNKIKSLGRAAALLGAIVFSYTTAYGQAAATYPSKPIRMVVPFPAGSATDAAARIVVLELAKVLKQPVIIDNRGGASGNIGAEMAKNATPDGYVIFFGTASTQAVNVALSSPSSTKQEDKFESIGLIGDSPYVIVAARKTGLQTINDILSRSKKTPGLLTYASAGNTSMANFAAQLFSTTANVRLTHVPYKSSALAVNDTISGTVDIQFATVAPVLPFVRSGALNAIAVTSKERMALLPNVPTISESGLPGYEAGLWMGLFAPHGTPKDIVNRLSDALRQSLAEKAVQTALVAQGIQITPSTGAQLDAFVDSEIVRWTRVAREARITGE